MPEQKIVINNQTQFAEVEQFFSGLGDNARVRSRSCEGGVELYVRGSSKLHIFTDLLRSARDVQKDYQEAKNTLFSIFGGGTNVSATNHLRDLKELENATKEHKHDFRAYQFKNYFRNIANLERSAHAASRGAIQEKRRQDDAHNRLDSAWNNMNLSTSDKHSIQQTVQNLVSDTNRSNAPENAAIRRKAHEFSKYLNNQINTDDDPQELDYVAAEDFALSWKQPPVGGSLKASDGSTKTEETLLTSLVSEITAQSVPQQVDLNAEPIGSSPADLIIVDPHSKYPGHIAMTMSSESKPNSHTAHHKNGDEPVNFSIKDHQKVGHTNLAKIDNALEINYDKGFPAKKDPLKTLYDKVGETIAKKISSRGKQSSDRYTIHMTILNPTGDGLASHNTPVALEAFADATLQWLKRHPNLRIKVQLPPGISEQHMLTIYRASKARLQL